MEISRGRGVLNLKSLEAKYEAKLEFSGGMGGGGEVQNNMKIVLFLGVWIYIPADFRKALLN